MGTNYVNLESFKLRQTQKGGDTFFTFGDLLKAKSLVSNACSINKIIVYSKHRRAGFFEVHSYQTHGTLAILRRVLCIKNFDLTPCSPKLALTLTKWIWRVVRDQKLHRAVGFWDFQKVWWFCCWGRIAFRRWELYLWPGPPKNCPQMGLSTGRKAQLCRDFEWVRDCQFQCILHQQQLFKC